MRRDSGRGAEGWNDWRVSLEDYVRAIIWVAPLLLGQDHTVFDTKRNVHTTIYKNTFGEH